MKKLNSACRLLLVATAFAGEMARADDDWDISKLDAGKLPPAAKTTGVTYAKDIRPLFEASCFNCHGEKKQKGDLRLDSLEATLKGGKESKTVIPNESAKSALVFAAARVSDKIAMPPKPKNGGPGGAGKTPAPDGKDTPGGRPQRRGGPPAKPLTEQQVGLVRAWIDQGAK